MGVIDYRGLYSILMMSCVTWSGALDRSGALLSYPLSYPLMSLASPVANILTSSLKHTYLHLYRTASAVASSEDSPLSCAVEARTRRLTTSACAA